MNFSEKDIEQIKEHGLTVEEVNQQIEDFKRGFPFVDIVKPATGADGIIPTDDNVFDYMANQYSDYAKTHKIVKFVPASGAASRMFKDLSAVFVSNKTSPAAQQVIDNLDKFAFWNDLQIVLPKHADARTIARYITSSLGLNYAGLPKGLIPFHKYNEKDIRTPIEEHMVEGAQYAVSGNQVNLHFTVSPEYRFLFDAMFHRAIPRYEARYNVKYNIEMSEQKSSTDTIAVNMDNTLFRGSADTLLFRPAGHGALIENLNNIDADLIFIKNIDNVTTDDLRKDTIKYKKVLAGILISTQKQVFDLIRQIDAGNADIEQIHTFITTRLGIKLPNRLSVEEYRKILNRPIRVCGMVKNTGAPGGGPFWVRNQNGNVSLQIVESSQIAPESKDIMNKSEYFNPVDLVCGTRDFQNKKFDLTQYVDKNTGFISEKSSGATPLRAMERPGLWNGAMANWNTIFVAVPGSTFSPVKFVADLLLAAHRTR